MDQSLVLKKTPISRQQFFDSAENVAHTPRNPHCRTPIQGLRHDAATC